MDDITTRVIVIAVNIFVTLIIVTLLILTFTDMKEIYGLTASVDTSIYNTFDNIFSTYSGKVETGMGLINTLKKFEDDIDKNIRINYTDRDKVLSKLGEKREADFLRNIMENNENGEKNDFKDLKFYYQDKYNVSVLLENDGITINFDKIKE